MSYTRTGLPEKQGMYDPAYEHDACGIGCVVNISGKKSHDIIRKALTVLENLSHRGGAGSEDNTGDGAGILTQIPDAFFRSACPSSGFEIPSAGDYGVGMAFLPKTKEIRKRVEEQIEKMAFEEGLPVLGWRTLPIDESNLGSMARAGRPYLRQIFLGKKNPSQTELDFERSLYVLRKRCEKSVLGMDETSDSYFYFASLSSRTIVYKGMLTAHQVDEFYLDLASLDFESSMALVHSRYSTNTFPSWERAHPYRYLIHNGEINTLRGNINWMNARQAGIKTDVFGTNIENIFPIINTNGSDSAMFDNCFEFLVLCGRSIPHVAMMMVPEPWNNHETMSEEKKAFYEYHNMLMEPWDGPAAMAFTDGKIIAATLDRNGLRPSRYYVTKDGFLVLASEAGVLDIPAEDIIKKERLSPGRMLVIDTQAGRIISDEEIKASQAAKYPYKQWISEHMLELSSLAAENKSQASFDINNSKIKLTKEENLKLSQKVFGYTFEEIKNIIAPMAETGMEPVGAMGTDIPLAVLSDKPQLLFDYFKQLFAQVTNPPIDAIREQIITATETYIGSDGNIVDPGADDCRKIKLTYPIISDSELKALKGIDKVGFKSVVFDSLFVAADGGKGLEVAMESIFEKADSAISEGANILILSDRGFNETMAPIPSLLAVAGLHHHLIRKATRTSVSIVLESGEPREVHHMALLVGYGASAICPYVAFGCIDELCENNTITKVLAYEAKKKFISANAKGIIKVISKMGISTILSYQASQIFEAIGLAEDFVAKYFTATASRINGIGIDIVAQESVLRHSAAYDLNKLDEALDSGGFYKWRSDGEYHQFNPLSVYKLQQAVRTGDYKTYKEYSSLINEDSQRLCTLRGLMRLKKGATAVPIEEVESAKSIVKRFKTGAMSYGSISKEAHEALAIAMNRLGGKSNTGEGGEDPSRFIPLENGDSKKSAIKQIASGRFGVTSEYLVNAVELQIKMAQGAKPGEGGQLPGSKVYPWIAKTRHSTPGVGLISPPPHHDIYSIEDLAELIYDLKNANTGARVNVKLVSEVGVGTVAAGVAKGLADVVLISGYDGGTGASPLSSIRHAGLPWELGLAEAHQTLVLNKLRSRIVVETDGKLMTGRDVVIAALLGAEEYGFATAPLVALGCVMMRVCNLDTCPVGVATQNPALRAKFAGKPEHVVNFMMFIAEEMREIMAELGFRTIDEMIGRTDCLEKTLDTSHWKASKLDLSALLHDPRQSPDEPLRCIEKQASDLDRSLDARLLIPAAKPALKEGKPVRASFAIRNINRVAGTQLGSEVTRRYGSAGLPEDTIYLNLRGSAGQSFGAFVPKGITLELEGDSNDYLGKGLSGGKIVVKPDRKSTLSQRDNIIIGNVALYGATGGEVFINGKAGERFAVRNSGVTAVVEGTGDHGCEYMTGGRIIVLGGTGRNFAAGMSGGIAYVYDESGDFRVNCNMEMVSVDNISSTLDKEYVRQMVTKHLTYTGSQIAKEIINSFDAKITKFVKVMPKDFASMLDAIEKVKELNPQKADDEDFVMLAAFEMGVKA